MTDLYRCPKCKAVHLPGGILEVIGVTSMKFMCGRCSWVGHLDEFEPVDLPFHDPGFA